MEIFLRTRDLKKSYGGKIAVDEVSIDVEKGSFLTVLGPMGCGKTTLLRLIAGLEDPDSGFIEMMGGVTFDESGVNIPPHKRNVSMVFQETSLWPHLNVRKNLEFLLERPELDMGVVEAFKLEKQLERTIDQLSGGQRRCVSLARALMTNSRIMALDEPFSSIDWVFKKQALGTLVEMAENTGMCILYVTHDQLEASLLPGPKAIMNDGKIIQTGSLKDIVSEPVNEFIGSFIDPNLFS